jgi:DNA-binding XRE family transcriptional regulator
MRQSDKISKLVSQLCFKEEHEYRSTLIRKAIGDLVRSQRKSSERQMTQEELAECAGISYEHLNHIENYKVLASIEVLDKIARALGYGRVSEFLALDESHTL